MTCFNPKYVQYTYASKPVIKNGKPTGTSNITKIIKFQTKAKFNTSAPGNGKMIIPCGKCLGCKLDKASDWATRSIIESKQWKENCFITLTYDNDHVPILPGTKRLTLRKKDIQDFFKRLRKHYEPKTIRYFACGEYGENTHRPHYHCGIFNWIPTDLKTLKLNKYNDELYTSPTLKKIWGKGFVTIGKMTYESASYISRYTMKKIFDGNEKYKDLGIEKEFVETSRRPGLARNAITSEAEFEKIKRNMGIYIKSKKGVKLKKIPQYLKNKWKDINRLEYFEKTDKARELAEEEFKKKLEQTDMNLVEYIKKEKDILVQKLKNAKTLKRKQI